MSDVTGEVTELLQQLIRNECVNTGAENSGEEHRNSSVLRAYLEGTGLDIETYEAAPGRESVVAKIAGTDNDAPSLLLMGHTDVVPVNLDGWSRDPFAGELVDGVVWGRGAIDMLNLTASMAVATKRLAQSGFRPKGDLIFLGVADEEAGGKYGAEWLLDNEFDAVNADYVLSENGGVPIPTETGKKLLITVAEKGMAWCTLRIKGTPRHASRPYKADNALVKAAKIVDRLVTSSAAPVLDEVWRGWVEGMGFDEELQTRLLDPSQLDNAIDDLPDAWQMRAHACTHTTVSPTVVHGGTKVNVIPDAVELRVDIRTLPGFTQRDLDGFFIEVLGNLVDEVEIEYEFLESTKSPIGSSLYDVLSSVSAQLSPGSACVPTLNPASNDNYYFRKRGITSYGAGLFSDRMSFMQFETMFHGNDERVDQESLVLSTQLWDQVARRFLV